jgi:hypothetical protein
MARSRSARNTPRRHAEDQQKKWLPEAAGRRQEQKNKANSSRTPWIQRTGGHCIVVVSMRKEEETNTAI